MNEYKSTSSSSQSISPKNNQKKSFSDRVDSYLRLVLSKNLVNRFWRFYYSRFRKILTISAGAGVLTLCMQNKVVAQLFEEVETGALDEFLPDGIEIDFFGEALQILLLAGGIGAVIGLLFQISRGGNAEVWVSIVIGFIIALIAIILWTGAIYGN